MPLVSFFAITFRKKVEGCPSITVFVVVVVVFIAPLGGSAPAPRKVARTDCAKYHCQSSDWGSTFFRNVSQSRVRGRADSPSTSPSGQVQRPRPKVYRFACLSRRSDGDCRKLLRCLISERKRSGWIAWGGAKHLLADRSRVGGIFRLELPKTGKWANGVGHETPHQPGLHAT